MQEKINPFTKKIYSSKLYERFITFQSGTIGKWQSNLLKLPFYFRWHSAKYYNATHWTVLFAFTAGIFIGIMLPFAAARQPGIGQEIILEPPSSQDSSIIASPNLLSSNGADTAEIEITLVDKDLNPLKNRNVEITIEGSASLDFPQRITSANGVIYAYLTSQEAGTKVISVKDVNTNTILEKTVSVEFTENLVQHWIKPGDIGTGAAAATTLEAAGNYQVWNTDAIAKEAEIIEKFDKELLKKDSCTLVENDIYCAGGEDENQNKSDNFYKINIFNGERTTLANLPYSISSHKLIANENSIYLIGGNLGENVTKSVYKYDLENNIWEIEPGMNNSRENFTAANVNNEIYVIGGYTGDNQINSLEKFETEEWQNLIGMSENRNFHASAVWNSRIYIFGGWDGENILNSGEVYLPEQNAWFPLTPMPSARWAHTAATHKDKIYIFGGYNSLNQSVGTIDIFDPLTNSWTTDAIEYQETELAAISLLDSILLAGGNNVPSKINEYIPADFTVKITENNNIRRAGEPSTQFEITSPAAQDKIITRQISNLDLSETDNLKFQIYSERSGEFLSFLMGENSVSEQTLNFTIEQDSVWEIVNINISKIPKNQRNNIRFIGFKVVNAQEPFKFNLYDIWTEGTFFSACPCEKEVTSIFSKSREELWSGFTWAAKEGPSSSIEISARSAQSIGELQNQPWQALSGQNLSGITNNFIELRFTLREEEIEGLPGLYSISVEILS